MSIQSIVVESPFGVTVRHRFHVHEPESDQLMVILPGRGYTINHPVLSYLGQMAYENGYDVLPVQYGFQTSGDLDPAQIPLLQQDVRVATEPVLKRNYREICVAGKSLGTPLAIDLAQSVKAAVVSQILLTPIGPAMQAAGDIRTLAIIGTADPLYAPELVGSNDVTTWRVLENLDHGLIDESDWRYSMDSLKEIIAACEAFLQTKQPAP
jgi:hypothetical protein